MKDICEKTIIVTVGLNRFPSGLQRIPGTVGQINSIQTSAEISRLKTFLLGFISKVKHWVLPTTLVKSPINLSLLS